ncbi:MAG TPA: FAD-binding oxidoreductase [Kiloniellales bacterium]|nr:FAD-binding oxidoreductase [Kiloniellales bacterium]
MNAIETQESAALLAALRQALGPDSVVTDPERLAPWLRDERGRFEGKALCLLLPKDTAAVAEAVRFCGRHRHPIVPQGGNTGLAGGATPFDSGREVLLNLGRLKRLRALDPEGFTITVEAGMTLKEVQEAAAAADRLFPLSLGAEGTCQIGGNIATNAGGIHVIRYGNTRELVLGLEVVLADGSLWQGLKALRKDNSGYDLKQLFIGAEGTLGIITAATLKLFPLPRAQATAMIAVESAAAAVSLLARARSESGERVTACEIMGRQGLDFARRHVPGLPRPLDPLPPWSLILELSAGRREEPVAETLEAILAEALAEGLATDAVVAQNEAQAADFWKLREAIVWAQKPEGASIKHDVSVPVASVPRFLDEALAAVAAQVPGLRPVPFGHLGDGNIHFNVTKPEGMEDARFLAEGERMNARVHDIALALGGSISAEHGIGRLKIGENLRTKDPVAIRLMQSLKQALDPEGLFNPGKVVPALDE